MEDLPGELAKDEAAGERRQGYGRYGRSYRDRPKAGGKLPGVVIRVRGRVVGMPEKLLPCTFFTRILRRRL